MNPESDRIERRTGQRFELHLPLTVHFGGGTVQGFTQDLSGRGMFFYAELAPLVGSGLELTFTMPSEITLAGSMRVRCRGRVLRVSASDGKQIAIAVQLHSYHYLPDKCESVIPVSDPAGVVAPGERGTIPG